MSRRVIFPDPEIWTTRQENTTVTERPFVVDAGDARRAAALTTHHRRGNTDGVLAIAQEVNETGRGTHLVVAILDLHANALRQLRTNNGIDLIGLHVQELASMAGHPVADNPAGGDICRAATLLDAHGRDDIEALNTTIRAAVDAGRPTQLILGLLDLYETLLPELTSLAGVDWLARCVNAFATEEVQDRDG